MEDTDVSMMKLSELEAIIERGLSSFIEVGNALTEIRDARMYGKEFSTFEEYCEGRWGFQNKRAYQLIDAAKCVAEMSTVVEPSSLPTTERQVRELKKATSDPAEQAKILKKAAKAAPKDASGKPKLTAGIIKKAAEKPKPSSDPEADRAAAIMASQRAAGVPSGGTTFDPAEFDGAMTEEAQEAKPTNVPKHLEDVAASCQEFAGCVQEAGRLKSRIEKLTAAAGGGKLAKWWSDIDRALSQVQTYLKCYRFWAACPECKITDKNTKAAKDCKLCGGHGWIAETNGLSDIHKDWLRERGVKV